MKDRAFLDTNVFVYAFDRSDAAKETRAVALLRETTAERTGVVSYQVVQEFFSVALRKFAAPMTVRDGERFFADVFRPMLAAHSSPALFEDGLRLYEEHKLSWYDALIVAAALQAGCTLLYTEDLQHGRRFGRLVVRNPFV